MRSGKNRPNPFRPVSLYSVTSSTAAAATTTAAAAAFACLVAVPAKHRTIATRFKWHGCWLTAA